MSKKGRLHAGRPILARLTQHWLGFCAALLVCVASAPSWAGSLVASSQQSTANVDLSSVGTSDWVHWGLTSATSVDRAENGGNQISDFVSIDGGNPSRFLPTPTRYSWSDGSPTSSATNTRTGLRVFAVGKGFSLSAPADATARTLKVYVSLNRVIADFSASLSDGSSAPISISVDVEQAKQSHVVTVDYSADSPGQTLDVSFTVETQSSGGSWITLDSAALATTVPSNQAPVVSELSDQTITEGDLFVQTVSATDADGPAPITLSQTNSLPGTPEILADNGSGDGDISWQSAAGDAAGSPYLITVTATDGAAASSDESFMLTVLPSGGGGGGSLSVSAAEAGFISDLANDNSPDDWLHWGRLTATSIDRKAGVAEQISDYSPIGGATPSRFAPTETRYRWSGGTPLASINRTRSGVRVFNEDRGFEFTVPADTSNRTVRVYVGINLGVGELTATLSDGSAVPIVSEVSDSAGRSSFVYTLQYAAASESQTLTISYVLKTEFDLASSWASLDAATMNGLAPANNAPSLGAFSAQSLIEGEALQVSVSASDVDGPAPLVLTETNDLPGSPALMTDNGDGTGELNWLSAIGDGAGSPYTVVVRATDAAGAFAEETFEITVSPGGGGGIGSLVGADMAVPSQVSLTAVGDADWVHWGRLDASSVDRKATGGEQISDYSPIDGALPGRGTNHVATYSWTDGAPTLNESGRRTGIRVFGPGKGFAISAPAGATERVLRLYVGANRAVGQLTASLSDNSATPFSVQLESSNAKRGFVVSLTYSAASANALLNVEYTMLSESSPSAGWASLESAALSVPQGLTLPYAESFDGPLTDWVTLDEAAVTSDWNVIGGEYTQSNAMGFNGTSMNGAAQVGTYSYFSMGSDLSSYRVSVMVRATADSAQDVGLMALVDPVSGDYVRFSLSGANSFARLETKSADTFTTLASNALGVTTDQWVALELAVDANLVTAYLDGVPLFAGMSTGSGAGSVGLYCRDACAFDDLLIEELGSSPELVIGKPAASTVRGMSNFSVSSVARNLPMGGDVEFSVSGVVDACDAATQTVPGYFEAICTVPGDGFYILTADMLDAAEAVVSSDVRAQVGVGEHYLSLGNSITAGLDDTTSGDGVSANGTVRGVQGYQAALTDALEDEGQTAVVSNSGVPGDTSVRIAQERIDGVLQRHAEATQLLLTIGVNDAGGASFTPSGLNCGASCAGTFAGNVQDVVDAATLAGISVTVAKAPPRFGDPLQAPHATPETHPQNLLINDEYNEVIGTQITGITVGPDFYDFFLGAENRFYLYQTNLHPNALGYLAMAQLFNASITGSTDSFFFATDLCLKLVQSGACETPLPYKQNLIEDGSVLYVDENVELSGAVPAELAGGRWLQTANQDRNQTNSDYLGFELPTLASIYVAYDAAAATTPAWLSGYTDTGTDLVTTSVAAPLLRLYRLDGQIGSIELPGADAIGNGAASNYLVILVAN